MIVTVVIPTLDEAARIGALVSSLVRSGGAAQDGVEVIVVDGGSRDATPALARAAGARVLASARGRARQLRLGSECANGDWIVFLHADTRLPEGWSEALAGVADDPGCAGGAFGFRLEEQGLLFRWIELWVRVRNALFRLPYGDQAIFIRRGVLEAMGGVPDVPILEDLDLVRGIRSHGRLALLALPATTSGRRYAQGRGLRTILLHQWALLGWLLGFDRVRLARRLGR
ncbi:MAG: TIGR04283 family arsenosugar biosynthesis glycosyltransferase [Deltaproteobacteria bacterium]|nr:TIGR04283 family arsenosugar biosynthesis glycosyltransferase [Deltaproteobacteria bacterium]